MFDSIPDNCDRETVKEMFWYIVNNGDTTTLWNHFKASPIINPSYSVSQLLSDSLDRYRLYHADSEFSIPFNDQLAIATLVMQCAVDPDKFGVYDND